MSNNGSSPVRQIRTIIDDRGGQYTNRILVATPTTGLVRIEWVAARYGQIVPVNWSQVSMTQYLDGYIPLRYQVDDAQNLCVRACLQGDFEWLFLLEHDVILPEDAFLRLDRYMVSGQYPVVSGLYFTRNEPSTPLVFRGRGTGVFTDWQMGDLVWCDGVPTGCLLIHRSILAAMWEASEEYQAGQQVTRRVFRTPRDLWQDPEKGQINATSGTSDLDWCTRVMRDSFFEKAGWPQFQEREFPFLVDTNLFCRHIDPGGVQYPLAWPMLIQHRKPVREMAEQFVPMESVRNGEHEHETVP